MTLEHIMQFSRNRRSYVVSVFSAYIRMREHIGDMRFAHRQMARNGFVLRGVYLGVPADGDSLLLFPFSAATDERSRALSIICVSVIIVYSSSTDFQTHAAPRQKQFLIVFGVSSAQWHHDNTFQNSTIPLSPVRRSTPHSSTTDRFDLPLLGLSKTSQPQSRSFPTTHEIRIVEAKNVMSSDPRSTVTAKSIRSISA